ncbi:MAG: endonuclease III [Planctomycetota bacterium]
MNTPVPQQDPAAFAAAESPEDRRERAMAIYRILEPLHPAKFELNHRNAFELLTATALAARSKDTMVNERTVELFRRWPDARALSQASPEEIEPVIKGLMSYRRKAAALVEMSRLLVEKHGGEVPPDVDALVKLPGVGRKTAVAVVGACFGINAGISVDTHVNRASTRLALAVTDDTDETEQLLCAIVPQDDWTGFTQRMVLHGRYCCTSSDPRCDECPVSPYCPSRGGVA